MDRDVADAWGIDAMLSALNRFFWIQHLGSLAPRNAWAERCDPFGFEEGFIQMTRRGGLNRGDAMHGSIVHAINIRDQFRGTFLPQSFCQFVSQMSDSEYIATFLRNASISDEFFKGLHPPSHRAWVVNSAHEVLVLCVSANDGTVHGPCNCNEAVHRIRRFDQEALSISRKYCESNGFVVKRFCFWRGGRARLLCDFRDLQHLSLK